MQVIIGPGCYLREEGLLAGAGEYAKRLGMTTVLIGGKTALSLTEGVLTQALEKSALRILSSQWFGGEASWTNINGIISKVKGLKPDFLTVVGGGKAIDTAKAAAYALNLPLIAIPTIASTCAAATPISIIYDAAGEFIEISRKAKAPDIVLVDSRVIAQAPVRFLSSGIGDTLAKWFESRASAQKAVPNVLNKSAVNLAKLVYDNLLQVGANAMQAAREQTVDRALEDIIDAIILVSGSVSGYGGDDCRTAGAHAIYSGLTVFPDVHQALHGEIVAFGILAQLVLEERINEIEELISFYRQVNLPTTLMEMGLRKEDLSERAWTAFGKAAVEVEDMANMPFRVTPTMAIKAVLKADEIGRNLSLT